MGPRRITQQILPKNQQDTDILEDLDDVVKTTSETEHAMMANLGDDDDDDQDPSKMNLNTSI
jgi:hypothetical protein